MDFDDARVPFGHAFNEATLMRDALYRMRVLEALDALAPAPGDPVKARIAERVARIEKVAAAAKSNWFWFFGILGYAALTLMGMKDADFFTAGKTTTLPILNFDVNILSFMYMAPLLIAVVFAYLHGLIEQAWEDLALLPVQDDGLPISARLPGWLVIEAALYVRAWRQGHGASGPVRKTPLGFIGVLAMGVLVWGAAPFVLGWFWLRVLVLHDLVMGLILGGAFWFGVAVSWMSLSGLWRVMHPDYAKAAA